MIDNDPRRTKDSYGYLLWTYRRRAGRVDSLLRIYAAFGVLVSVTSTAALFLTIVNIDLSFAQMALVSTAGVGAALATLSATLLVFRRELLNRSRDMEREDAAYRLMIAWHEFESAARNALATDDGEPETTRSVRSLIGHLITENIIDAFEADTLQLALTVRNRTLHFNEVEDVGEVESLVMFLNSLASRISVHSSHRER
jgi:hypothetical protein